MVYLTYNLMVVSYWNSTSNHNGHMRCILLRLVVSYWNSTSNHNSRYRLTMSVLVVSYWNSTSNHNSSEPLLVRWWLYLIEILHQTTTLQPYFFATLKLYLIEILHQTTTMYSIAPRTILLYLIEILHQTTTEERARFNQYLLYLIEILHQTTTLSIRLNSFQGCILLKFYIKPQRQALNRLIYCIIYQDYHHWKVRIHTLTKSIWCISACQRTRQIYASAPRLVAW